jgi:hypothetical protein
MWPVLPPVRWLKLVSWERACVELRYPLIKSEFPCNCGVGWYFSSWPVFFGPTRRALVSADGHASAHQVWTEVGFFWSGPVFWVSPGV